MPFAVRSALLTLAGAFVLAGAAAAAPPPALRIVADGPLALRGTGFRAGEAVRVTVRMNERRFARDTRAARTGRFTVTFPRVRVNYCATPLTITARGSRTGTVRARIPRRECAIP